MMTQQIAKDLKIREVDALEMDIRSLQDELAQKQTRLESIRRGCNHLWSEPAYEPIHTPGYTIPGDAPGTMGSDWRGPMDVPSETKRQWKRYCKCCKLTQTTSRVKKVQISGNIPGTTAETEVPAF